jgi:hypothetical protein
VDVDYYCDALWTIRDGFPFLKKWKEKKERISALLNRIVEWRGCFVYKLLLHGLL